MASRASSLVRRIKSLVRLGATTNNVEDTGELPLQQIAFHKRAGPSVPWFPYGYHASPKPGLFTVIMNMAGRSESRAHLPSSAPKRPKDLEPGEVVYYHPDTQSRVHLKNDSTILIDNPEAASSIEMKPDGSIVATAPGDCTIDAPLTTFTGDVQVDGDLDVDGATTLNSTLDVVGGGATTLTGTLDVTLLSTFLAGAAVTGVLTATGDITALFGGVPITMTAHVHDYIDSPINPPNRSTTLVAK